MISNIGLRYRIGTNDQRFHSTSREAIWVPQRYSWCNQRHSWRKSSGPRTWHRTKYRTRIFYILSLVYKFLFTYLSLLDPRNAVECVILSLFLYLSALNWNLFFQASQVGSWVLFFRSKVYLCILNNIIFFKKIWFLQKDIPFKTNTLN